MMLSGCGSPEATPSGKRSRRSVQGRGLCALALTQARDAPAAVAAAMKRRRVSQVSANFIVTTYAVLVLITTKEQFGSGPGRVQARPGVAAEVMGVLSDSASESLCFRECDTVKKTRNRRAMFFK